MKGIATIGDARNLTRASRIRLGRTRSLERATVPYWASRPSTVRLGADAPAAPACPRRGSLALPAGGSGSCSIGAASRATVAVTCRIIAVERQRGTDAPPPVAASRGGRATGSAHLGALPVRAGRHRSRSVPSSPAASHSSKVAIVSGPAARGSRSAGAASLGHRGIDTRDGRT